METKIIEIVEKKGALGLTIVALIWMNNRLSNVEDKLYDCLKHPPKITQLDMSRKTHDNLLFQKPLMIAVLPNQKEREIVKKRKV
jgi:hypothetical protein